MMQAQIKRAKQDIALAAAGIEDLEGEACNNVYDSLEDAVDHIEEALLEKASEACEGSYCLGLDTYTQMFMVDGEVYKATLKVEYNRHDKRFYYVDGSTFDTKKVSA